MVDESLREHGPVTPDGPNTSGEHVATTQTTPPGTVMTDNEFSVFKSLLLPDDSYDENGTYWADMSLGRQFAFCNKVDSAEAKKELRSIWEMIKVDPLSPVSYYFKNMVIPGMGLLLEGYVLFSIGNIEPLLAAAFPSCWGKQKPTVCSATWISLLGYLEIIGIIVGQIVVGILGDWLGRRFGLIQDAVIMFLGLIMLTASWGTTLNGWVICYAWALFIYGIGVGGEYPMTATSGMENAVGSGKISTRDDRLHRGRKVTSAFLMQGWGQLINSVILIVLLLIFNSGRSDPPYHQTAVEWTYRLSFAIPAIGTLWLVYYRTYKMRSASKQLDAAKKKQSVTGYDVRSLGLTFTYFGGRLLAAAGGWFANDVFFYGNKLFSGQFIAAVIGNSSSVMDTWKYNLLNIAISLVGYYLASFLIDNKLYGRRTMQQVGFLADFICFVIPGFAYKYYSNKDDLNAIHKFMACYFISSFFNQFGPNSTTFLVAAECFPTQVRASAHGFAAAWGKFGALFSAVLYSYIGNELRFTIVPWFGLAGMLLTWLFLPDTTGLDLKEQERRWAYIRAGREKDYHGVAVHPRHLSLWERWYGLGKQYNADLDYQQRVEEMRAEWETSMARRTGEKEAHDDAYEEDDFSPEVSAYFERTGGQQIKRASTTTNGDAENPTRWPRV